MKDRDANDTVMDRLSSIWGDLQQMNRFPWNGQLMSTCEAELQELMKQIDIMVQNKKVEWERELQASEAKLQLKERECTMQKATAEQKAREILQLRQQLDSMERSNKQTGGEYERNVEKVKMEFDSLRRDYEKLQKKMNRHSKEVAKEKTKTSTELQDTQAEMQRAHNRLEDYRQRSKDWELEKRNLEKQIESLESQRRTLQEKCDLIEQQASGYQSQLDKRRQILDNTEYNLKTQITQLEAQLERSQDTISAQDSQIGKLKASFDETVAIQRRLLEEKDFSDRELRDTRTHNMKLEGELSSLRLDYHKQEEYIRLTQAAQRTPAPDTDQTITPLSSDTENLLKEKDMTIKKLSDEVKNTKSDVKQHKKNEKKLNDELSRQKAQIKQAEADVEKLRIKFQEKMGSMRGSETKRNKQLQSELSKLRQTLATQTESSEVLISDLHRQMDKLKEEAHERGAATSSLTERLDLVQRQHRHDHDKFDQRSAELQVTNAQLEALRLENSHLRQTAMKHIQTNADVMEAEAHLKELQNAYTASLSRIEGENQNLHDQLNSLQARVRQVEGECADKERHARSAAQRSIQELQTMEERRIQDIRSDYEKRLNNLQSKMERRLRDAQTHLNQTLHEKSALEDELNRKTSHMKRAYTENEVMSHFVEGVSEIMSQPPEEAHRIRMVTPRLVGLLDEPFMGAHFETPLNNLDPARAAKTSTKVHFNESDLPNHSLVADHTNNESAGASPDRADLAGSSEKSGTRLAVRKSVSSPSLTDGRVELRSPYGRDSEAPSPGGPSPRTTSPLRFPSPSHAFQRVSPHVRSDLDVERAQARSEERGIHSRAPQDGARAPQEGARLRPGAVDAAMANLSLSDPSDTERPTSRASLATRFYEEEQERAKELEKLIDSHIEDLKHETERTIRKYTR